MNRRGFLGLLAAAVAMPKELTAQTPRQGPHGLCYCGNPATTKFRFGIGKGFTLDGKDHTGDWIPKCEPCFDSIFGRGDQAKGKRIGVKRER